ncbi:MAG: hypothetical protein Q9185_004881 [Variospora sp. 1 TL-2023]
MHRDGQRKLEYIDSQGVVEVLEDKKALCDATGCRCHGPILTCGHTDGHFYEPLFAQVYTGMCFHSCHCDSLPAAAVMNGGGLVNIGDVQVVETEPRQRKHPDERSRLEAVALGERGCLRGKSAGWTLEAYAAKSCCPDTQFQALTPQEAHMKYNVAPTPSDPIAKKLVTIGLCL